MELVELLKLAAEGDSEAPQISHVDQIARLREFKDRLDAGNKFKIGDLVTPRADSPINQKSAPHLVVAIREPEYDFLCEDAGACSYGGVFDLRVVHLTSGITALHWVESVYFELYTEAHERVDSERDYEVA